MPPSPRTKSLTFLAFTPFAFAYDRIAAERPLVDELRPGATSFIRGTKMLVVFFVILIFSCSSAFCKEPSIFRH